MKFAREFRRALEEYPQHWVDSAIPYSQLKKCLKNVQRELGELGLDHDVLRELLNTDVAAGREHMPLAKYGLSRNEKAEALEPRLTIIVQLQDGVPVDASLSPASRAFLSKLAADTGDHASIASFSSTHARQTPVPSSNTPADGDLVTGESVSDGVSEDETPITQTVEVPLVFDAQFFDILREDVSGLDALQRSEQKAMADDTVALGREIEAVTKPSRFAKSDLYRWREIFELYLDARIFFSTQELDHGARNSSAAVKQLVWFQEQVMSRGILSQFKLPQSKQAYAHFLTLNANLLQNLKFQEINQLAFAKILKKFDKRTSLHASAKFSKAIHSDIFMAEGVAKDVCARVSAELVSTVPRVEDYLCPVCFTIAWIPVRLACKHVFCIRCVVKLQRQTKKHCPMCRAEVIMDADITSIDSDLVKFEERWFRKETHEKQKLDDVERGKELFGESYDDKGCVVM